VNLLGSSAQEPSQLPCRFFFFSAFFLALGAAYDPASPSHLLVQKKPVFSPSSGQRPVTITNSLFFFFPLSALGPSNGPLFPSPLADSGKVALRVSPPHQGRGRDRLFSFYRPHRTDFSLSMSVQAAERFCSPHETLTRIGKAGLSSRSSKGLTKFPFFSSTMSVRLTEGLDVFHQRRR